jgi:hypothetical protein
MTMNIVKTALSASLLAALSALPTAARAQDNAAAVEALFNAGKKLMADGNVAEACPKFLASYNLEHRVGTLLNLADCYERSGQLASAWGRFVEARNLAQRAGQPEREAFASDHAKALEPRLSTLAIQVTSPPPGFTVQRDGLGVEAGAYGVAVAIDGGAHEITASAPGMKPWTGHVTVQPASDHQTLSIPPLEPAPVAVATPAPTPVGETSHTQRYIAIGTAGVGVVAIGIGTVFGVEAISKNSDSNAKGGGCGLGGANNCNASGVALRQTAVSDGTISTVFIGVGAAAVLGGVVLWLTGRPSSSTTVGFDGRNLLLRGEF